MESPAQPPARRVDDSCRDAFPAGVQLLRVQALPGGRVFCWVRRTPMEQTMPSPPSGWPLPLSATVVANHLRISIALVEICVGMFAALAADHFFYPGALGANLDWLRFIASVGAVLLTFLAGAELDPAAMKTKLKEVTVVGLFGFFAPFLGCAALARFVLGWSGPASWLAGIALSTTSMAVVYAVMLESGFNRTEFGKGILGACFVNDLGTVIALGADVRAVQLPDGHFRRRLRRRDRPVAVRHFPAHCPLRQPHGRHPHQVDSAGALRAGALALWSGNEAVLPAYLAGMVLAKTVGRDHFYIRRLRTLTVGFLTPFYFLRAGSLVSLPAILSAPLVFVIAFCGQVGREDIRAFPGDRRLPAAAQGAVVLHADDVHGPDVRHDFRPLRAVPQDRDPGAVLVPGGHGHCQRRDSDDDRQRRVPAAAFAARPADGGRRNVERWSRPPLDSNCVLSYSNRVQRTLRCPMSKTVTLRLSDDDYQLFRPWAESDNRPLSNFIETATKRFIEAEANWPTSRKWRRSAATPP